MSTKTVHLIVWASIFLATLLLSFILFQVRPDRKDRVVLFFPSEATAEWIGEGRNIPHMDTTEESVHELLKEITLGPIRLRLGLALPRGTRVRSVVLSDGSLYIDLSEHVVLAENSTSATFVEMLEAVRKSVLFNFPSIDEVVLFVRGYSTG
jgi:hypothetical protein